MAGFTEQLAQRAAATHIGTLPSDVLQVARDCLLDIIGVTLAAARDPLVDILVSTTLADTGPGACTLIGRTERLGPSGAALVNGAASHTLDYDDVNLATPGHCSAAITGGLLALAESRGASGRDYLAAFVAGYETMCRAGQYMTQAHYDLGFHATVTLGNFGAAAACAHLLGLDTDRVRQALGLAATQSSGLKIMFGTMTKPLHAGMACRNGLFAANLAAAGFGARADAFEALRGFGQLYSPAFEAERPCSALPDGAYVLANLFKFHAACYSVHSTIECAQDLIRDHGLQAQDIDRVVVRVGEACDSMCNIQDPQTGFESKFSLRAAAAFGWRGLDTSDLGTYSAECVTHPQTQAVLQRVSVELMPGWSLSEAEMSVTMRDGRVLDIRRDSGIPLADKAAQSARIKAKFRALAAPAIGMARCDRIIALVDDLEGLADMGDLVRETCGGQ